MPNTIEWVQLTCSRVSHVVAPLPPLVVVTQVLQDRVKALLSELLGVHLRDSHLEPVEPLVAPASIHVFLDFLHHARSRFVSGPANDIVPDTNDGMRPVPPITLAVGDLSGLCEGNE